MQYLKVLGDFYMRPYEAFKDHKGKHMRLSIALGILLSSPLIFFMVYLMDNAFTGFLLILLLSVGNLVATVALLHFVSLFFDGKGKWQELLSLYGFTTLPNLLPALVTVVSFVLNVPRFRMTGSPEVITAVTSSVMPMAYFEQAMKIATYIYSGLAISSIYKLKWTKVVACIVVSVIAGSIVSGPLFGGRVPLWNLQWESVTPMLENVEELHLSFSVRTSAVVKTATMKRHELVLVQPEETIYLRTADSANSYYRGPVLAKLFGVPGDKVNLESGTLIVNGESSLTPDYPLPHLTLAEFILGPNQYFIYFTSPAVLGSETRPELFIISSEQIVRAVSNKSLSFLRWVTR